jgi:hypothetical protein
LNSGCCGRNERSFIVRAGGVSVNRRVRHGCGGRERRKRMRKNGIEG